MVTNKYYNKIYLQIRYCVPDRNRAPSISHLTFIDCLLVRLKAESLSFKKTGQFKDTVRQENEITDKTNNKSTARYAILFFGDLISIFSPETISINFIKSVFTLTTCNIRTIKNAISNFLSGNQINRIFTYFDLKSTVCEEKKTNKSHF